MGKILLTRNLSLKAMIFGQIWTKVHKNASGAQDVTVLLVDVFEYHF